MPCRLEIRVVAGLGLRWKCDSCNGSNLYIYETLAVDREYRLRLRVRIFELWYFLIGVLIHRHADCFDAS